MRLALWTPRPDAAWVAALVPLLEREVRVEIVAGGAAPEASLDLYHVADDPAHVFVHRALRRRPGVVLLADWSLHRLARAEAMERGGGEAYRAEARRAHGTTGAFVARQVERGLGGELPSLLAMNDRVLEASLGLVAFTESVRARAAERLPGRPVVHLPLDFVGSPVDTPPRGAAREALGVPAGGFLVALLSAPGERAATALRAVRAAEPGLRVQPWPEDPVAGRLLLAAADVAVALEHAPRGGLPSPLVRAIVAGVPTLVSAGTGAASDLPEGVAVRVSPGPSEGGRARGAPAAARPRSSPPRARGCPGPRARRRAARPRAGGPRPPRPGRRRRAVERGGAPGVRRAAGGGGNAPGVGARGGALGRPLPRAGGPPAGDRAARRPPPAGGAMTAPSLSVVVPAYNEARRLPATLARVRAYLRGRGREHEIVVVDDGSSDTTAQVARDAGADVRVLRHEPNRGKGYAVRRGMLAATGARRLITDADLSTPIEELAKLEAEIERGFDVAIGSRAVAGALIEVHQPAYREVMGRLFNRLVQALLLPGLRDTQCGFKLFTARAAQAAFSVSSLDGFSFDVEALYVARHRGLRIAEVPVTWRNDAATRVGLGGGAAAFADLVRIRLRARRGAYGAPGGRPGGPPT